MIDVARTGSFAILRLIGQSRTEAIDEIVGHIVTSWLIEGIFLPNSQYCRTLGIATVLRRPRSLGGPSLPTLRHAVGDAGVLVAGEAEADEPLAIELPRRLLQQRHPPPVVLDQVVVGGEDVGNALLMRLVERNVELSSVDHLRFNACAVLTLRASRLHVRQLRAGRSRSRQTADRPLDRRTQSATCGSSSLAALRRMTRNSCQATSHVMSTSRTVSGTRRCPPRILRLLMTVAMSVNSDRSVDVPADQ